MKLLLVLILVCTAVGAMSMKDSVDYALKNSPEYQSILLDFEKNTMSYKGSDTDYHPDFTVSTDNSGKRSGSLSQKISAGGSVSVSRSENVNQDDSDSTTLQFSQQVFQWRDYDKEIRKLNYEISKLQFTSKKQDFIVKVISKFYSLLKTQERLSIRESSYERWELSLEYAKVKFESGSASKFDVLNAQLNLLSQESSIIQIKDSLETEKEEFKRLLGMPMTETVKAEETVVYEEPPKMKLLEREDRKISELSLKISGLSAKKAKDSSRPAIRYTANRTSNTAGNFWSTGASYTFNIGAGPNDFSYYRSRAEKAIQEISHDIKLKDIDIELRDINRRIKTSAVTIKLSEQSLKNAEESYEFSKMSFQEGLLSIIDLQDAQTKLTEAKQGYIFSLIDNKLLNFEYIRKMGGHIEDFPPFCSR